MSTRREANSQIEAYRIDVGHESRLLLSHDFKWL
jgi:hypothetical protein